MGETNILLEAGTNELEIAEFRIQMLSEKFQSFGINVAKVREIILVPEYDEIPRAHPCIMGVFQLRSKVIPLIDLSRYLKQKTDIDMKKAKVIIAEFNNQTFGFLIHEISTILRVSWESVLPPTQIISGLDNNCITSVVPMDVYTLFMLDFEKIVSDINPETVLDSKAFAKEIKEETGTFRVLIADDSMTFRDLISNLLIKGGFEVHPVNDGKEALDYLNGLKPDASGRLPLDIVVSDIEMPQMDGLTLCRTIKESPTLKELPVILFSSLISDDLRAKGEKVGASAQISKPDFALVVKIARELVKNTRAKS